VEGKSRRRHDRRKTLLRGVVVSRDGSLVADAVIRELSESGAKLVLADGQVIPERVYLVVSGRNCAFEAAVVRAQSNGAALSLGEMHTLETLTGTQWQFLRRFIVERLPRSSARE
jgi:hypothetical protein